MTKSKNEETLSPFQGSIEVSKDTIFEEDYVKSRVKWDWTDDGKKIEGEMNPSCLSKQLKKLFKEIGVKHEVFNKDSTTLKSDIPGLPLDDISPKGSQHIKLQFSGTTYSDFEDKKEQIQAYLKDKNISFKEHCMFFCPENARQTELTAKFMADLEKLR